MWSKENINLNFGLTERNKERLWWWFGLSGYFSDSWAVTRSLYLHQNGKIIWHDDTILYNLGHVYKLSITMIALMYRNVNVCLYLA